MAKFYITKDGKHLHDKEMKVVWNIVTDANILESAVVDYTLDADILELKTDLNETACRTMLEYLQRLVIEATAEKKEKDEAAKQKKQEQLQKKKERKKLED